MQKRSKKIKTMPASNTSSFFCLDTKKRSKKNQDCARFARSV